MRTGRGQKAQWGVGTTLRIGLDVACVPSGPVCNPWESVPVRTHQQKWCFRNLQNTFVPDTKQIVLGVVAHSYKATGNRVSPGTQGSSPNTGFLEESEHRATYCSSSQHHGHSQFWV